jgi:hypothetical protein
MSGAPALGSTLSVVRAVVLREAGGPEVLRVEEVPDPLLGEGEVLVRVEAVGINHVDLTRRAGGADTVPLILGYDAAGRREDGGERVLVTGTPGTYAELVAAKEENVFAIPDSLVGRAPVPRSRLRDSTAPSAEAPERPQGRTGRRRRPRDRGRDRDNRPAQPPNILRLIDPQILKQALKNDAAAAAATETTD